MILKDENMEEYCSQRKAMFECFFELFGKLADIKENERCCIHFLEA